jgi:hypothetical protein
MNNNETMTPQDGPAKAATMPPHHFDAVDRAYHIANYESANNRQVRYEELLGFRLTPRLTDFLAHRENQQNNLVG